MLIRLKRIYEKPEKEDGKRILVDRIWPRGISRQKAKIDLWLKEIAPSSSLRRWFGHDPKNAKNSKFVILTNSKIKTYRHLFQPPREELSHYFLQQNTKDITTRQF